jgi:hypothetical protein
VLPTREPTRIELYEPARRAGCVQVEVIAPPEARPMEYRLRVGGEIRERTLLPGGRRRELVPVRSGLRRSPSPRPPVRCSSGSCAPGPAEYLSRR